PEKLELQITINKAPTCKDLNGILTTKTIGGVAPYSYLWTTGSTSPNLNINGKGTYSVTVTDSKGCFAVQEVTISITCMDLALIKQVQNPVVKPGDPVKFKITVFNQGVIDAYNIEVVDYLPAEMILNDANWVVGTGGKIYLKTPISFLAAGTQTSVELNVTVSPTFKGKSTNFAEIFKFDDDTNPNNNPPSDVDSTPDDNPNNDIIGGDDVITNDEGDEDDHDPATITVLENPIFDLALTKTTSTKNVKIGDLVTFEMKVYNQGNVDAYNINIVDYLPNGFILADTNWVQTGNIATLKNPIWTLYPDASFTVKINLVVDSLFTGISLKNCAEISSADNDLDSTNISPVDIDSSPDKIMDNDIFGGYHLIDNSNNDEDDHDCEIINVAGNLFDLALIKTTTAKNIKPGSNFSFSIKVTNQGDVNAYNINVIDYLPAGLLLNDTSWTLVGTNAVLNSPIAFLAPGASATVQIKVKVDPNFKGKELTNIAEISSADNDTNSGNTPPKDVDSTPDKISDNDVYGGNDVTDNSNGDEDDHDKEVISVENADKFDLAVIKTTTTPNVKLGDAVIFSIKVSNQGNVKAYNIQVVDYLPAGLILNDANWNIVGGDLVLKTPIASLDPGSSTTVTLNVQVDPNFTGTSLTNIAEILFADNDTNPGNTPPTDVDSKPDNNPTNDVYGGNDIVDNSNGDEDDHDKEVIFVGVKDKFDLALIKTTTNSNVKPGDNVTFSIKLTNQGNVNAFNIQVVDYLPTGLTLNDANWNVVGGNLVLKTPIATLAAGASTTVTLNTILDPNFAGTSLTNIAEILFADNDTNPGNTPPTDVDSTPDNNPNNDVYGGNDIVDNSNGDEDDHDKEVINVTLCNLSLTYKIVDPSCNSSNGSIDITVSNGSGNYAYNWADLPGTNDPGDRMNLSAGTYSITVTDVTSNCTAIASVSLKVGDDIEKPTFDVPANVTVSCENVPAPPKDTELNAKDNCGVESIKFNEVVVNGNCKNNYTITRTWVVTDVNGNQTVKTQVIVVEDKKAPVIMYTNPILVGLMNGDTITFECNAAPILNENDVKVTDNCDANPKISFVDELMQPGDCKVDGFLMLMTCAWIAEDACGNTSKMQIFVKIVDTQAPTIKNVPSDVTINLASGQTVPAVPKNISAVDNCDIKPGLTFKADTTYSGCDFTIERKWTALDHCNNMTIQVQKIYVVSGFDVSSVVKNQDCTNKGEINLTAIGGVAPYKYDWADLAGVNDPEDRTGLLAGAYDVTITDAKGCNKVLKINVKDDCDCQLPVISSVDIKDAECGNNGSITINLNGNLSDYTFSWSPISGNSNTISNLAPGSYTVIIGYKNNIDCYKKLTINVKGSNNLDVKVISTTDASACNAADGKAELTNGNGFTYKWSDGSTLNPRNNLSPGTYSVTITNTAGCSKVLVVNIGQNSLKATAAITNDTCNQKGAITLTVTSTLNLTYNWADLPGIADPKDRTNLVAGTYSVTITDSKGCTVVLNNLVVKDLCKPCGVKHPLDTVEQSDCSALLSYCLDYPFSDIQNYNVTDNGAMYTGGFEQCLGTKQVSVKVDTGYHILIVQNKLTNCKDTIPVLVKCTECKPFYTGPTVIKLKDCTDKAIICLDVPVADKNDYTFTDNNFVINSTMSCNNDTMLSYTYATLLAVAPTGPYKLQSWTINGKTYTSDFANIQALVSYMNTIDKGLWVLNMSNMTISGGNTANNYGKMVIYKNNNLVANLDINKQIVPGNISLMLTTGVHFVNIVNEETGCDQLVKISVQCDSTSIQVNANDDQVQTPVNKPVNITPLSNDIIPGFLESFKIMKYPQYGTLVIKPDYSVEYIPFKDVCDKKDEFVYFISNGYTVDEATVTVDIICDKFVIYNGITPNSDGLNDLFIIEGIEKYPNNEVSIYNRWGNKVYTKKAYSNDQAWDATWDGKLLPDGTYFYIIKDGEGAEYSGYLQIHR
ncbi:MAG: DUF11 domain-containing protein, partial [Saprospiraceae bacterium]|nr:DUF11 domain-containing protein [Saprospiraceae bacterium]